MALNEATFSDEELLDLLRDGSVSPASIVSEMREAGVEPLPSEAIETARRILTSFAADDVKALEALPERLQHLVCNEAISAKATDFVTAVARCSNKSLVKDAKRAIHLLKTRGVAIEAPRVAPSAPAPTAVTPHEELPTFMTSVDGFGERFLFFCSAARGGVDVVQISLSDELGITTAGLSPLGRKEYKKFIHQLNNPNVGVVGEVPRPYARGLVSAALDLMAKARRPVPSSYNEVSFLLGPAIPPRPSPGRTLSAPENQAEALHHAEELLQVDVHRTWALPDTTQRELLSRLDPIQRSSLYVDEAQREEALRTALDEFIPRFWTPERRRQWASRLFDNAYLLHEGGRKAQAEWTLATALALESDAPVESIPFCYALFSKNVPKAWLRALQPLNEPPPQEDSPLILP